GVGQEDEVVDRGEQHNAAQRHTGTHDHVVDGHGGFGLGHARVDLLGVGLSVTLLIAVPGVSVTLLRVGVTISRLAVPRLTITLLVTGAGLTVALLPGLLK